MKIHAESRVHHPLETVYLAYRDELPLMAPYIPDVREIVVSKREVSPGRVNLLNIWHADREVPKVAQTFVKPEMLMWEDYAEWDDAARHANWTLVIPAFRNQVRCSGRNAMFADGPNATRVVLTGELEIEAHKVPGVPKLLARRMAPKIEAFIVSLVTPNLRRVNASLEQYLDERG